MPRKLDYIPVEKGQTPIWSEEEYLKHIIARNTENSQYLQNIQKNIEVAACVSEKHHKVAKKTKREELRKEEKRRVTHFLIYLTTLIISIKGGLKLGTVIAEEYLAQKEGSKIEKEVEESKIEQKLEESITESEFDVAMVEYTTLAVRILNKYTYDLGSTIINTPSGTRIEKLFGYDQNGIGKSISAYSYVKEKENEEYTTDILLLEIYKNIPMNKEGNMKRIFEHITDSYDFGATSMQEYYSYLGYQSMEEFEANMKAKAADIFEQKNKRGI